MTLGRLREIPRSDWPATTAGQAMIPLDQLKRIDPKAGIWDAMLQMDRAGVNQLPVSLDGRIIGMLSREDVLSTLRTLQELGT